MALTKKNYYKKREVRFETSWDDGHVDDWRVWELLKKHKIRGTFYVVTHWLDEEDRLTWKQIEEIDAHELGEIGAHTMTHPSDLKGLFENMLDGEVEGSKRLIESALGHHITKFCYPRGRYDERVKDCVKHAGFLEARTTTVGKLDVKDKYEKPTTVHVFDDRTEYGGEGWYAYAVEKLEEAKRRAERENITFHLWGHGYELTRDKQFDNLEKFFKYAREQVEIV